MAKAAPIIYANVCGGGKAEGRPDSVIRAPLTGYGRLG